MWMMRCGGWKFLGFVLEVLFLWLVVSTPLKNISQRVNMGIFPNFRGENKKYLKPTPRNDLG